MAGFGVHAVLDSNIDSFCLSFLPIREGNETLQRRENSGINVDTLRNHSTKLVSPTEELLLCVRDALFKEHHLQKRDYKLDVHICEAVDDIAKACCKLQVDFVVFVMDTRKADCLDEVRSSVQQLGAVYKHGRMCLVNSFCEVSPLQLSVSYSDMQGLARDLGVHFLNADVTSKPRCLHLAARLANLCATVVGLRTGVPLLDIPPNLNNLIIHLILLSWQVKSLQLQKTVHDLIRSCSDITTTYLIFTALRDIC